MAPRETLLLSLLALLAGAGMMGCGPSAEHLDEERWRQAETQWKSGEPTAYAAWRRLDPQQKHGRAAWARMSAADLAYRRAIDLLRTEQPGLRETLSDALALAPMDPALYLPLARACRARGTLWRAADFYRKFLAQSPPLLDAAAARGELAALGGDRDPFPPDFDRRGEGAAPATAEAFLGWRWPAMVAAALLVAWLALWGVRRRRNRPLCELVRSQPEVHQTVAYQIGCLRHEFLKHRIGAAGEALAGLVAGRASREQRQFLEERLCKGEPLLTVWRAHVDGLDRSLGLKRSLVHVDPLFRGAEQALQVLGRAVTKSADPRRVREARECLQEFDRELGDLVARLVSCSLDEAFLREVLASTRAEWSSGKVDLDEVMVGPVPDGVAVDVYRTDLRIVLKNIFRNAIAALADSPHPRRLAVDVVVDIEPTGEEVVRVRVRDSSRGSIAEPAASDGVDVEHGLGIVRTALLRYDGSIEVERGEGGYAKAVVVRLFRSQTATSSVGEAA